MMRRFWKAAAGLALLLAAAPAGAQPAAENGPVTLRPDNDDMLQDAAMVVGVERLEHQGGLSAKLFGAASGDPAMNGLHTYLAFFVPPPENGWQIFEIGDFLAYTIIAETPGRLLLEISESVMHANGNIGARTRRLAISWTPGRDNAAPATVTVAPARAATRSRHRGRGRR
jgi:hypothetical protein